MSYKDPKKQYIGWRSHAKGKAFEEMLDASFAYYADKGSAQIEKTPEPMKLIRSLGQGRFVACYTKSAQPDYKGTIKGGRTVMFEAKYTEHDRILQSAVSDVQAEYLDKADGLGARCFVVCGFSSGNVYRIPWGFWRNMKKILGHKYVKEEEIQQYQIKRSWNGLLLMLD